MLGFVSKLPPRVEGVADLTLEFPERLGAEVLSELLDGVAEELSDLPDTDSVLLFPLDGTLAGCVLACPEESILEGLAAVVVPLAVCKSGR